MKKFLSHIPGFKSNVLWKKTLSVLIHLFLFIIIISFTAANNKSFAPIDTFVNIATSIAFIIFLIISPYILVANLFHIRSKLPIFKKNTIKATITGFILSALILISLFGISNTAISSFASPELKEAIKIEREKRNAESARLKAEKEAAKKEESAKKDAENKAKEQAKEEEKAKAEAAKKADADAKAKAEAEAKAQVEAAKKAEQEAQARKEKLSNIELEFNESKAEDLVNLTLTAIDKKTGTKLWGKVWNDLPQLRTSPYRSEILEKDDKIYISVNNALYGLNKETGAEIFKIDRIAYSNHALAGNIIICTGGINPFITAVTLDGSIKWQHADFSGYKSNEIKSVDNNEIQIKSFDKSMNEVTVSFDLNGKHLQTKLDPIIEFKNSCTNLNYHNLIRYPENTINKNYKIHGKVSQIIEEKDNSYLLNIVVDLDKYGYSDKNITVEYVKKSSDPRIIENDILTVWGTFKGIKSYQRTLNNSEVHIPNFQGKYLEIN